MTIYFKYPPIGPLKKMSPKERLDVLDNKFQKYLEKIKTILGQQKFDVIGTKRKPRGIKIETDKQTLAMILKLPFIEKSFASATNYRQKKKEPDLFFCVRVIVQVQIEGVKNGLQTIDEQFLLVKAGNQGKAEAKVKKNLSSDQPYLNPYGQLVRWKLDSIIDVYTPFMDDKDNFEEPVEVFSKLRTRKLRKENIWDGK